MEYRTCLPRTKLDMHSSYSRSLFLNGVKIVFRKRMKHFYKLNFRFLIGIAFILSAVITVKHYLNIQAEDNGAKAIPLRTFIPNSENRINLVSVICNNTYVPTFMTMVKSAIVFQNSSRLHFITFIEPELLDLEQKQFMLWRLKTNNSFTYEMRNVSRTSDGKTVPRSERQLKCTMERLRLPDTMTDVNKILYLDSDTLFLSDVSDLWDQFELMNSSQICGAVTDDNNTEFNAQKKNSSIPHPPPAELNAGVLLMNLEKMRKFGWSDRIAKFSEDFKSKITAADRDVINIFFANHPETLLLLSKKFNYNTDECRDLAAVCKDCVINGLSLIQGSFGLFRRQYAPNADEDPFHFIHRIFSQYEAGDDPYGTLFKPLLADFANLKSDTCKILLQIFLQQTKAFATPELMRRQWKWLI